MKNEPCVTFHKGLRKWVPGGSANYRRLVKEGIAALPTFQVAALVFSLISVWKRCHEPWSLQGYLPKYEIFQFLAIHNEIK